MIFEILDVDNIHIKWERKSKSVDLYVAFFQGPGHEANGNRT